MKNYSFIGEAKKGLLIAALFCLAAPALAGDLTAEEAAALAKYETAISSADPAAAKKFLEDAPLADKLKLSEPERAAELTAKAQAVTDLAETLDRTWRSDQEMELSRALSLRIDFNKPLVKVGIGPAPEPLLAWMAKYRAYSAVKTLTVKKAIREFETVFGTSTVSGKAGWNAATIRERNALLSEKAAQTLDGYINNPEAPAWDETSKPDPNIMYRRLGRFVASIGPASLDEPAQAAGRRRPTARREPIASGFTKSGAQCSVRNSSRSLISLIWSKQSLK